MERNGASYYILLQDYEEITRTDESLTIISGKGVKVNKVHSAC